MFCLCRSGAFKRRGLSAALIAVISASSSSDDDVRRIALQAQLGGGFVTDAELTLPANVRGRVPAVLLIHGATPADMDFTVARRGGDTTRVFREIADSLAAQGIATLRYNKRWVTAPGRFDAARFYQTDLQALLADARVMLDTLRAQPQVDGARIVVWGWSEGSGIAAQLAAHPIVPGTAPAASVRGALAGVIVHGPVVRPYGETLRGQFRRIGVPYLLRFAASDSTLDLDALTRAEHGDGGMLARSQAMVLLDPYALQRGERKLSAFADADSNGRVHVTREALVAVERFMQGPMLGIYADGRALPGWAVMADSVRVPLLVLHGEADANIPVSDARALEAQLCRRADATVRIYPALGHTLGAAADPEHDDFRPIARAPLRDAARWITALPAAGSSRASASPASPRCR